MPTETPLMAAGMLERQARWLERYRPGLRISERGSVVSVGDGIAWITGLPSAAMDDILAFEDGSRAMVFDLTERLIGAVLLHDTEALTAGAAVQRTGRTLSMPVGDALLGRIIDPLGTPLDGGPPPAHTRWQALESSSPPIVARDFVHEPLYTGIRIIDTMIPIGKGQRQLLIGDEGLGRSSVALDTVINQRGRDIRCIYVLIGQKRSTVVNTIETLREHGALEYSTLVVAEASSLPGLQHLAPFAGCAAAEFWMRQGRDVLVVYDDLSTHAKTYRELSLLLRRPPGREAYPGDIFSVHARLLERATCLNAAHGGGSMTALPIVETQLGEIASYIPTNLISITDGQIYLDHNLFAGGFRPAIDIARSVSRIGGQAQHPRIKEEAGRMKLDYLQFLELEVFTRFGARLEASMEAAIRRGRLLREILKQDRLSPLPVTSQMAWLVAFNDGLFEDTDPEAVAPLLRAIEEPARRTGLSLDSPREEWSAAVAGWLSRPAGGPPA
ncbi:MAG TPA: F0F1 ATP synthase subunit alpha [Sedimenticola sp.]|nr:F0F1 ATP synthase subunit alpha [Sedimenticola sp.]